MRTHWQSKATNYINDGKTRSKPLLILGGGGHAKVLIDALRYYNCNILGITDPNPDQNKTAIMGVNILGTDEKVFSYSPDEILLVNAVGSAGDTVKRKELFEGFKAKGYSFYQVIHVASVVSPDAKLGEGLQAMAGAVIQPGCIIGNNTIINTNASIDHDCCIGSNVHIAPGVTISGNVVIEDEVHIGSGSTILQGLRVGHNSIVGAGSLVLSDVPSGVKVYGSPAKVVSK